jgi:transcriptional regulator with XRE-family HTH domain
MEIGQRIREIRRYRNVSLKALAIDIDVSTGFLSRIELNQKKCSFELLERICQALGVSFSEFFASDLDTDLQTAELMAAARQLTPYQRQLITDLINSIIQK